MQALFCLTEHTIDEHSMVRPKAKSASTKNAIQLALFDFTDWRAQISRAQPF